MAATETHVAFVRAVMIGREGLHRAVLLDLFAAAGARDAVSYISTGNVSFRSAPDRLPAVVAEVEQGIEDVVGRRTEVFVRSLDHLRAMAAADPYATQPLAVDHVREVTFFRHQVPAELALPLSSPAGDVVVFAAHRREVFSVSVREPAVSRGAGGIIERAAGERVTTRNWSTVARILDKLA